MKSIILYYSTLLQLTLASPSNLQRRQTNPTQQQIPNLAGGSCMLSGGILWYLGGYTTPRSATNTYSNKLYSISLNTNFNLTAPPWQTSGDVSPDIRFQYGPSAATDNQNGLFYIFGANSQSDPISLKPTTSGNNKLYKYDVIQGTMTTLPPNPSQSDPQWRFQHTLNYYQSQNQLILHGGRYFSSQNNVFTTSNSTYLFDIGSNSWSLISQDGPQLYYHYSIIYKDQLIIMGGMDDSGVLNTFNSVYIFDLKTKTWTKKSTNGPNPNPVIGMSLALAGSTLATFGGYANEQAQFSGSLLAGNTLDLDNFNWDMKKTGDLQNSVQRAFMCVVTTNENNFLLTQGEIDPSKGLTNTNSVPSAQLWDSRNWSLISNNIIAQVNNGQSPITSKLGIILMAVLIPLAFIFITWLTCYLYRRSQSSKQKAYTVNEPVWTDPYEKNNNINNNNNSSMNTGTNIDSTNLTLEHDRQIDNDDPMSLDTDLFSNPDTVLSASQSQMNILPVNGRKSYYE